MKEPILDVVATAEDDRIDDTDLLQRYRQDGDQRAREALIERYLPLSQRLARRYKHSGEDLDDLYQVASLALLKALDRFDPDRGSDFASYAVPTILGEVKRHFRDHTWAVHMPRDLQERTVKVSQAIEELGKVHGRAPSVPELAERLSMEPEAIVEALSAASAYATLSLEAEPGNDPDAVALGEGIGEVDPGFELAEYGAAIQGTLREMPERERVVLHLRFVEDMTQTQIAERIGVSQMQVSRLIRKAVSVLRESANEDSGTDAGAAS